MQQNFKKPENERGGLDGPIGGLDGPIGGL